MRAGRGLGWGYGREDPHSPRAQGRPTVHDAKSRRACSRRRNRGRWPPLRGNLVAGGGARFFGRTGMKVAVLGGGGFRAPLTWESLANVAEQVTIDEVALYDVAPARL